MKAHPLSLRSVDKPELYFWGDFNAVFLLVVFLCVFVQLAPSLPLQEDFVYHWKAITHYYIETSGKKQR